VPRDPFNPLSEKETFSHRDFWRRFERVVLRDLSQAHATGVRGIQCARDNEGEARTQVDAELPGPVSTDRLRDLAVQTGSRWAAWLADTRIHLVYGHGVELESMLLDGTWYHSWYQRVTP
jgi:hypothetical protein